MKLMSKVQTSSTTETRKK